MVQLGLDLADAEEEVLEDLGPVDRVPDLGMKLDGPDAPRRILEARRAASSESRR